MAANDFTGGTQNYYGIAYGYLSTKTKSLLNREIEITEAELKSKMQNIEQLDLRKVYVKKDDKFTIFYPSIEGIIKDVRIETNEHGTFLLIELLDKDLETSIVNTKLHNKYATNFLNRFLNIQDLDSKIRIAPYSMPSAHRETGKRFYNSGVALYENGEKVSVLFEYDGLPKKEEVKIKGATTYDNTKQVDFLIEKFKAHYENLLKLKQKEPLSSAPFETTTEINEEEHDDLPF